MEASFEDLIAQRFPIISRDTIKELVKYVSEYFQKEVVARGKTLHPLHHSDKLTNFTKFADFIQKADPQTTTTADIVKAVGDYWEPYYDRCMDNPLSDIGGNTAKQMIETAQHEIEKESKRMFCENFKTQGAVIIIQYVLLWYLWAQSKRTDQVIQSSLNKLEQIKEECIDPALHIMYIHSDTSQQETKTSEEDKRYKQFNENLDRHQYKLAQVYLNHATRRLEDSMDLLEDKKQASMIHGVIGCVATVASAYFTAGLGSGFASLWGSSALRGSALCIQQGVFTVASGTATAGFVGVTVKHGWNYQRCEELLDKMKEFKKEVDREKKVLEENMNITVRIARDK